MMDYCSCWPFGKALITAGMPAWIDEDFTVFVQILLAFQEYKFTIGEIYQGT